jgi:uncharacterized Zn finger protein
MARAAELRALALLLNSVSAPVKPAGAPGLFSVASARGPNGHRYTVDLGLDPPSCTCPHFRFRKQDSEVATCKHIEAARLAIRARSGLGVPLP